jgi:Fe-S cluster biosynthesis and repair protein YggX
MKMVNCVKLGKELEGFEVSPFYGELGERILNEVSKEAWSNWLEFQTMLINENNLNLMDEKNQAFLKEQLEAFLFGGEVAKIEGYTPK